MREAELADGTILEFPDETPIDVIQATVKRVIASKGAPAAPTEKPTWLERTLPGGGFLAANADLPLKFTQGALGVTKTFTDLAGAGNPVSTALSGASDYLQTLTSSQSRADAKEMQRLQDEAEGKGAWEEIKAAAKAIGVAPLDFLSQGAGSTVPFVAAAMAAPATALPVGIASGAGMLKGDIYDAVIKEFAEKGLPPEQAQAAADEAQAYIGENTDSIAVGGILGGIAARFGFEPAVAKGIVNKILLRTVGGEAAESAAKNLTAKGLTTSGLGAGVVETGTEAVQAGQERLAQNVALQREGFDQPTWEGVAGQATLEGIAGGILGGGAGVYEASVNNQMVTQAKEEEEAAKQAAAQAIADDPNRALIDDDIAKLLDTGDKEAYRATIERISTQYGVPDDLALDAAAIMIANEQERRLAIAEASKLPGAPAAPGATGATGATGEAQPGVKAEPTEEAKAQATALVQQEYDNGLEDYTDEAGVTQPLTPARLANAADLVVRQGIDPRDALASAFKSVPVTATTSLNTATLAQQVTPAPTAPLVMESFKPIGDGTGHIATFKGSPDVVTVRKTGKNQWEILNGQGDVTVPITTFAGSFTAAKQALPGIVSDFRATKATTPTAAPTEAVQAAVKDGTPVTQPLEAVPGTPNKIPLRVSIAPGIDAVEVANQAAQEIMTPVGGVVNTGDQFAVKTDENKLVTGMQGRPLENRGQAQDAATQIYGQELGDPNIRAAPEGVGASKTAPLHERPVSIVGAPNPQTDISQSDVTPTVIPPAYKGRGPAASFDEAAFREEYKKDAEARAAAVKQAELDAAAEVEAEAQWRQGVADRYDRATPSQRMRWYADAGMFDPTIAATRFNKMKPKQRLALARKAGILPEDIAPKHMPAVERELGRAFLEFSEDIQQKLAARLSPTSSKTPVVTMTKPWAELSPEQQTALFEHITADTATTEEVATSKLTNEQKPDPARREALAAVDKAMADGNITRQERQYILAPLMRPAKLADDAEWTPSKFHVADVNKRLKETLAKTQVDDGTWAFATPEERKDMRLVANARGGMKDVPQRELEAWGRAVEGKTLLQVADILANSLPPVDREIAIAARDMLKRLQNAGFTFDFRVLHVNDPDARSLGNASGAVHISDFDGRHVTVTVLGADMPKYSGVSPEYLLHELVHAVTATALEVAKKGVLPGSRLNRIAKELLDLTAHIQAHLRERLTTVPFDEMTELEQNIARRGYNAFADDHETLAWGLTNGLARQYLETIPYKGAHLWTTLVRVVRRLLGLEPEADTALSAVLGIADKLLTTMRAAEVNEHIDAARAGLEDPNGPLWLGDLPSMSVEEKADATMASAADATDSTKMVKDIESAVKSRTVKNYRGKIGKILDAVNATVFKPLAGALPSSLLAEQYSKVKIGKEWHKLNELLGFTELDQNARGMKSEMVRAFTRMGKRVEKFVTKHGVQTIADAMHTARNLEVDVSAFSSLADALKNDPIMAEYTKLMAQPNQDTQTIEEMASSKRVRTQRIMKAWSHWAALGKQEGGHELYRELQQYYKDMYAVTRASLNARIDQLNADDKIKETLKNIAKPPHEAHDVYKHMPAAFIPEVYFPFRRYGKYWLSVKEEAFKSKKDGRKEFYQFESAWERDRFLEKRAKALGHSDKTGNRNFFETGNDIEQLQKHFNENSKMLAAMYEAINKVKTNYEEGDVGLSAEAVSARMDALKDELYQVYLLTLPERSLRKQFMHAENVPGYSSDIQRNFRVTATSFANQLPKLKYGGRLDRLTEEARANIGGWDDLTAQQRAKLNTVIDELSHRAFISLNPPDQSPVVTLLNTSAFLFLLSSTATALVQTTSIPMRVIPHMAAHYGYAAAFKVLAKYSPRWSTVSTRKVMPDGTIERVAPTFVNEKLQKTSAKANGFDPAKASKDMEARDTFEENSVHAMLENRQTDTGPTATGLRKVQEVAMHALTTSFSMAERMTREMTGLMLYELEFDKLAGKGLKPEERHKQAVDAAITAIHKTLGDYSAYERPRYLHGDFARFAMLFKMYAINTTMFFYKNSMDMTRDALPAKDRIAAGHEIAGVLLMSAVFSGLTGMPLYSMITMLVDALDDDDDPETLAARAADPYGENSADWYFRNRWLPETFGSIKLPIDNPDAVTGGKMGLDRLLEIGPMSALSGVNIANRTAYNNMWLREGREGKNATESVQNWLFDNFSPSLSVGFNIVGGVEDMNNGDFLRGVEKMVPALVKGGFSATRLATEGSETRGGDMMVKPEDLEAFPLLMQVAGFQPTDVAVVQQKRIHDKKVVTKQENELRDALQKLNRARLRPDDQDEFNRAFDAFEKYNNKYPGDPIDGKKLEQSWRQFQNIKERTIQGTYYPTNEQAAQLQRSAPK